jgi:hypothetical protein
MSLNTNILSSICKYLLISDIAKLHEITKFNPNLQIFRGKKYFKISKIDDLRAFRLFPIKFFVAYSHTEIDSLPSNDDIMIELMKTGKTLFIIANIWRHTEIHSTYMGAHLVRDIPIDAIQSCNVIILHKGKCFRVLYCVNDEYINNNPPQPESPRLKLISEADWTYIMDGINDENLDIDFKFVRNQNYFDTGRISFKNGFLVIGNLFSHLVESNNAVQCCNYIKISKNKRFVKDLIDVMIDIVDSKKILDIIGYRYI